MTKLKERLTITDETQLATTKCFCNAGLTGPKFAMGLQEHCKKKRQIRTIKMNIQEQIKQYISSQTGPKRADIEKLHERILQLLPKCKLWFLDGKDEKGKVVSNPNIGYGLQTIKYADGKTRDFYQVGISANTTGISVYVMSIEDKKYLPETYGKTIGKASVTGYCIKFKTLEDINFEILEEAIQDGVKRTST